MIKRVLWIEITVNTWSSLLLCYPFVCYLPCTRNAKKISRHTIRKENSLDRLVSKRGGRIFPRKTRAHCIAPDNKLVIMQASWWIDEENKNKNKKPAFHRASLFSIASKCFFYKSVNCCSTTCSRASERDIPRCSSRRPPPPFFHQQ